MQTLIREGVALWRARALVWVLAQREIASRHAGTAAGVLWPYVQPMLTVAVFYLVFDLVFEMRLGADAPTHAVGTFLIVGMLPWMAFSDACQRGMSSLVEAGSMLQKNPLPPVLFAARSVLASTAIFGPLLLLVAAAYMPLHRWQPALTALVPLLLLQFALSMLIGYGLAILTAALRDTVPIVSFLFSVGVYLAPILFPLSMFPEAWRWLLWVNPMTGFVLGYQQILLLGQWPGPGTWIAALVWLSLVAVLLNLLVKRSRDQLVDWL